MYSSGGGVKAVDYRNAQYQGSIKQGKREGLGIVVDDDMNIWVAEWRNHKMQGMAFVHFRNGQYLYGEWKSNLPHGTLVARHKEYTVVANYHQGKPVGSALVFNKSGHHIAYFNYPEPIVVQNLQLIEQSSQLQATIIQKAQKNSILFASHYVSPLKFLQKTVLRYPQYIIFQKRQGHHYFGFTEGLAMKFGGPGKAGHSLGVYSVGWHQNGKLVGLGLKQRERTCTEQGHFGMRQTITYNTKSLRPDEKCHLIYQKHHKKALYFANQYFQNKPEYLSEIYKFIDSQVATAFQKTICQVYQRTHRRTPSKPAQDTSPPKVQYRLTRDLSKYLNKHKKRPQTSLSAKQLTSKQKRPYIQQATTSKQKKTNKQIQNFKKTECEKCQARQKSKSPQVKRLGYQSKSLQHGKNTINSKSLNKLTQINTKKDKNNQKRKERRALIQQQSNLNFPARNPSQSKKSKQQIQKINEIKIRQQLFHRQLHQRSREEINTFRTNCEAQQMPSLAQAWPQQLPNSLLQYHPNFAYQSPSYKPYQSPSYKPYQSPSSKVKYFQDKSWSPTGLDIYQLDKRRDKILQEYRELNRSNLSPLKSVEKTQYYREPVGNNQQNPFTQIPQKRYRNHLDGIRDRNRLSTATPAHDFSRSPSINQKKILYGGHQRSQRPRYEYYFQ